MITEAQATFHRLRMGLPGAAVEKGKAGSAKEERPQDNGPGEAQKNFCRYRLGFQRTAPARKAGERPRGRGTFHLSWLKDAGLELSWNGIGQVTWTIREGFQKIWDLGPGERLVNHAWECWLYAKAHRREILAALKPCKGWIPTRPIKEGESLEELELECQRGEITVCPFLEMWIAVKDCPKWCGRTGKPKPPSR